MAIIVKTFPEQPVFMVGVASTCAGLGLILGPTLGGALYQWGGFAVPFIVMALFTGSGALLMLVFLTNSIEQQNNKCKNLWQFMCDLGAIVDGLSLVMAAIFLGFNATTLEPHLRQFE